MFDWLRKEHQGKGEARLSVVRDEEPKVRPPRVEELDPAPFETKAEWLEYLKKVNAHSKRGAAHVHLDGLERWDRELIKREQAGWKEWPHEKLFAYVEERGKKPDPVFDQKLTATIVAWARGGIPSFHSGSSGTSTWPWEKAESVVAKARQNLLIDAEIRKNVLGVDPRDAPVYPEPWKSFRVKFEGSWYVVAAISHGLSASGTLTYFGLNQKPLITFGTGQWSAALPEGTTP